MRREKSSVMIEQLPRMVLDALPAAIYTTDAAGKITYFNQAAVELAGRQPAAGEHWCVTWRLYSPDGTPLPHDQCPMAIALREQRPVRDVEAVAERPDGTRVPFVPFPTPLRDQSGAVVGAVNMLVDVSKVKAAERMLSQRVEEQAALYRFTDTLYRAESLEDVYGAALDAIVAGLRCERASILLFDDSGVMRFVAWRGLSEAYRKAVEGHSPWKAGDRDPAPIHIDDVAKAELGELGHTIEAEGIGALAFIPILANGELVGKFMTYYAAPHAFSAAEIDLSLTIARQLGFSIERNRLETARQQAESGRRQNEERLRQIFQYAGVGMVLMNMDYKIVRANAAFGAITERSIEELRDASCLDFTHPDDIRASLAAFERVQRGEGPVAFEKRYVGKDGRTLWVRKTVSQAANGDVLAVVEDITSRRRADEQRTLLINELNHRVKNTLATVQAIASQTFSAGKADPGAKEAFEARLIALSNAHSVLTEQSWESAEIHQIVEQAMLPHADKRRFGIDGPPIRLKPRAAVAIAMGIHELATNAAKYGALTNGTGHVSIRWDIVEPSTLSLRWQESGGPAVKTPERRGFGSRLIERNLSYDLDGAAKIDYLADGVVCVITGNLQSIGSLASPH
jgi:PAS domain S-box-containing protein